MEIPIYQVDAFTTNMFGGNPAAVCVLPGWIPDDIMQKIAAENNLSETAFLVKKEDYYEIRWFTPTVEVNLCGHATLASAYVLFHELGHGGELIRFESKSGELKVFYNQDLITLDFPADPPAHTTLTVNIGEFLGKDPEEALKGKSDLVLVYKSEDDIINLRPDFIGLLQCGVRGIIVTAPGKQSDFVSRFFGPSVGINEDPVTGSAHTLLTPFWANRLGKDSLSAIQLSRRKGRLLCQLKGDRVWIGGEAVKYLEGKIYIDT